MRMRVLMSALHGAVGNQRSLSLPEWRINTFPGIDFFFVLFFPS